MSNVLGGSNPDLVGSLPVVLANPDVRVHLYGKSVKPGRKVGLLFLLRSTTIRGSQNAWKRRKRSTYATSVEAWAWRSGGTSVSLALAKCVFS